MKLVPPDLTSDDWDPLIHPELLWLDSYRFDLHSPHGGDPAWLEERILEWAGELLAAEELFVWKDVDQPPHSTPGRALDMLLQSKWSRKGRRQAIAWLHGRGEGPMKWPHWRVAPQHPAGLEVVQHLAWAVARHGASIPGTPPPAPDLVDEDYEAWTLQLLAKASGLAMNTEHHANRPLMRLPPRATTEEDLRAVDEMPTAPRRSDTRAGPVYLRPPSREFWTEERTELLPAPWEGRVRAFSEAAKLIGASLPQDESAHRQTAKHLGRVLATMLAAPASVERNRKLSSGSIPMSVKDAARKNIGRVVEKQLRDPGILDTDQSLLLAAWVSVVGHYEDDGRPEGTTLEMQDELLRERFRRQRDRKKDWPLQASDKTA